MITVIILARPMLGEPEGDYLLITYCNGHKTKTPVTARQAQKAFEVLTRRGFTIRPGLQVAVVWTASNRSGQKNRQLTKWKARQEK